MGTSIHPSAPPDGRGTDRERRIVFEHLERWEAESLVSHAEAEAIRTFESASAEPPRSVPLIAEVIGYLGAALVFAAAATLFGRVWTDLSRVMQLAIPLAFAAALFVLGWPLRARTEAPLQRLAGVLWTLSAGGVAGFMMLLLLDVDEIAPWSVLAIGLVTAAYATFLLRLRSSSLLQAVLFGSTFCAIVGIGVWTIDAGWAWLDRYETTPAGIALFVLSVLWIAAGRSGVLTPRETALVLGTLGVLAAPLLGMASDSGVGLLVGVAVAAGLLGGSVTLRSTPMLALGAIGLFGYLTGAVAYYLADTTGMAVVLLISGIALLGVAVLTSRLRRFTRPTQDVPEARG